MTLGTLIRYYRDEYAKIARLGVLSLISAQFQAAALILVVPIAKTIAEGDSHFVGRLGTIDVEASTTTMMVLAAGGIIGAALLDLTIAWMRSRMMTDWEFRRRERVISEYLHADYSIQAGERLSTLSTLTGFVNRGTFALGSIVSAVTAILTIGIFLAGAIFLDYRAALFLIGAMGLLWGLLRPVMRRTKQYSRALAQMLLQYSREVTEATQMAREVRVFHASDAIATLLTRVSARLARVRQRAAFVSSITSPVYQYSSLLLVIGGLAVANRVGPGNTAQLGAIALLLLRSLTFGQQVQNSYQKLLETLPYVAKLEKMRTVFRENVTHDGTVTLEAVHDLVLDDVRFSYDGEDDAVAGVSAAFTVGEIVGIVGPSGSGKSTLSQLILRLREPTAGDILVNRVSASEYTLASWYRHVSLVPQDPRLFHGTVVDNISFLDPTITRERIVQAARDAGVHDVIESLADGYDTLVGPAFRDLSGGQIQRIGIARALARGAQVLVLDEPTSALDVHSEEVIQHTLEALRGRALVLIIAHRLSTLSICDRVLVMRDGQVETAGTLNVVSERSDFFRRALDAGTLEIGLTPPTVPLPDEA